MAALQIVLALSALTYAVSGAGVTNVQVTTGLNAFSQNLDVKLSALNNDLAAQEEKFSDVQTKLAILEEMLQQQILLTCDTDSCPNKQSPNPDQDDLPPPPPQNPIKPALVGCTILGVDAATYYEPIGWNPACSLTVRPIPASCSLTNPNSQDAVKCMDLAHEEAKKGQSGCVNASYGACTCTVDATLPSPAEFEAAYQETYAVFGKWITDIKSVKAVWYHGPIHDGNGVKTTQTYMKYDCKGSVGK